jgi:hypothetical protein
VSSFLRRDALEDNEYIKYKIKLSFSFYTSGEVWKENFEFFLIKQGEIKEEVSLKQLKGHDYFKWCDHKERVFENGSDKNSHWIFKIVDEIDKELVENLHCEGSIIAQHS